VGWLQGGEALKVYLAGLKVEPDSEALREGVQQAKDAINAAKARYAEYWGKSADEA
jgi:hypothetical protein